MTLVCMIICHFNDPHLTCALASLEKQTRRVRIILVDDASDLEFKTAYASIKDIEVVELSANMGIGNARNVGLQHAFQQSCHFIGFLDSDGIAHPEFVEEAVNVLSRNDDLSGVCARKGLANPDSWIARMKYRYKIYKKDEFQLDCSLFSREAFCGKEIPARRAGEDSVFISSFRRGKLAKLSLPYFHFERESLNGFFRDEYYGALHSYKPNHRRTFVQILLTPYTSAKMILRNQWILEGLLFPFRQLVWLAGYLNGSRLAK